MAEPPASIRPYRPAVPERATTLILVPTMMIVFIALAAIAVDLSMMHMTKRRALNIVSLAASDAAGMLDDRALQTTGTIRIDPDRASRVAAAHINSQNLGGPLLEGPTTTVSDDGQTLTVSLHLQVDHVFLGSFPAAVSDKLVIRASARLATG